jgi:aminopeptidase YwaD
VLFAVAAAAADAPITHPSALALSVRGHMQVLAGPGLRGRGSATEDEHAAANYIAGQLKEYGIEPAASNGGYVEQIALQGYTVTAAPILRFQQADQHVRWNHGEEFSVWRLDAANLSGPLVKIDATTTGNKVTPGAVVYLDVTASPWTRADELISKGAAFVMLKQASAGGQISKALPRIPSRLPDQSIGGLDSPGTRLILSDDAAALISSLRDGTTITLDTPVREVRHFTWNAIGELRGSDPQMRDDVLVLSAHLDHLGIGPAVKGRSVYYGADDDASGVSAVLELARNLGSGPRPKRTVVFAFFGSEEIGGLGSTWFEEHPPVRLDHVVAGLEFEMLGRLDPKIPSGTLWLSGYERTNLGPALDQHGAHLVPDPHVGQSFFERSDNYVLAKKGVIAQTVSSFGLHKDYHQPTDDLAHIDFTHLDEAIESMIAPITWLANTDFKPAWNPGGRP